jgi:hypothetical protein
MEIAAEFSREVGGRSQWQKLVAEVSSRSKYQNLVAEISNRS